MAKKNENSDGMLQPKFFHEIMKIKGKFLNGPFANMIFQIIKKDKNNLKVLIGNFKVNTKISNALYYLP